MTGLILSIAVLVTGTFVPNVEAKGKPIKEDDSEPKFAINFSCTDRKGELNCKATSRDKIGAFKMDFPDGGGIDYTGTCQRSQPFGDSSIETGTYEVEVHECGTDLDFKFEITVDARSKITSIVQV
jgi:hypothetical protein